MKRVFNVQATIVVEQRDTEVEMLEAPPASTKLYLKEPASVPFGKFQDPEGMPVQVSLVNPIPGCSVSWNPANGQVTLNWAGVGQVGIYSTDVVAEDVPPPAPTASGPSENGSVA